MAERLGKAVLELVTDDGKLVPGVNRAHAAAGRLNTKFEATRRAAARLGRGLRNLGRRALGVAKGFVSMRGALVGVAAAGALGLVIKRSIDAADKIAKTAKAASVSAEALQEYRFAARRAGVETSALDKAMLFLIKSMAELKTRASSELTTALQEFNPELLETLRNTTSQEQAFRVLAEAIRAADTDLERAAIARAAFGRGGLAMVNMLRDGTAGLDEMAAKARELGLVMSNETAAKAEEAADALGDLADVLKIRTTIAVAENADTIRDMATQMTEAIPEIIAMTAAFLRWTGIIETPDTIRLTEVRDRIREIDELANKNLFTRIIRFDARRFVNPMSKEREDLVGEVKDLQERIAAEQEAAAARQLERDAENQRRADAAAAASAAARENMKTEVAKKEQEKRRADAVRFLERVNNAFLSATDQQITLIEKRRDADLAALEAMAASEEEKAQARVEINRVAEAEITEIRNKEAEKKKRTDERDAKEAERRTKEAGEKAAEAIEPFKDAAGDAFKDVIKGTKTVAEAFEDMATRILDALVELAINDLLNGTNNLGAGGGGGGFGGILQTVLGGIGGIFGGGGSVTGGGVTPLTQLAHGNPFHRGGIVGRDGGRPRPVAPSVFANAGRFHRGGLPGLKSNEVAAILENDEEVLTRDNPRHAANGGGRGATVNMTVVTKDAPSFRRAQGSTMARGAALFDRANMRNN